MELYKHDAVEVFHGDTAFKTRAHHRHYVQCQAIPKNGTIAFVDITMSPGPLGHKVWAMVTHKPNKEVRLSSLTLENHGTECVEDPDLAVSRNIN